MEFIMNYTKEKKSNIPGYLISASALLSAVLCLSIITSGTAAAEMTKLPGGLEYQDTKAGTGEEAVSGKTAIVHYTGWLNENGEKGKKFDSSVDRGQTFSFPLGGGAVIQGWDQGVLGMKTGGKRTLYIPSELGYGQRGAGNVIPPNSDLIFDVELVDIK
jgi:peptidylprolyl isomerase